jgi:predicted Zn-ribbon and HTH transcriptional regulator
MGTIRQEIIDLLSAGELGLRELSQELRVSEKDILPHLKHIDRSMRTKGKRVIIRPARCLGCGFVFRGRSRYTRPGKCPLCRSTHIDNPSYRIAAP